MQRAGRKSGFLVHKRNVSESSLERGGPQNQGEILGIRQMTWDLRQSLMGYKVSEANKSLVVTEISILILIEE